MNDTIYSLDEARTAFVRSANAVMKSVPRDVIAVCSLISGNGTHQDLDPIARSTTCLHWALLADLEHAGYASEIEHEIEGLTSCIEAVGLPQAISTVEAELPQEKEAPVALAA